MVNTLYLHLASPDSSILLGPMGIADLSGTYLPHIVSFFAESESSEFTIWLSNRDTELIRVQVTRSVPLLALISLLGFVLPGSVDNEGFNGDR